MLPTLLGVAAGQRDRWRPLSIVAGFVLAFTAVGALFGVSTHVLGVSQDAVRRAAALTLMLAGGVMIWSGLSERVMARLGSVAGFAHRLCMRDNGGIAGGLLLGATLGALWTPCAGPVLASILALVAQAGDLTAATPLLAAYSLGAGVPMLAIAYGGQALTTRLKPLARHGIRIRQAFGVLVVTTAAAMFMQVDTQAIAWLARLSEGFGTEKSLSAPTTPAGLGEVAPEFVGIDHWLNSEPLSMQRLRGRVVLLDFWTYGCVNCARTLPHVQRWHERFAPQGLVVVGVHTPEFSHERSLDNLRAAVGRFRLGYPIAQDNGYRTWKAWGNLYWPALYLIDRDGRIVFRHFGEGDEAAIERRIGQLLREGPDFPEKPIRAGS
jgi:cytochrome c biogenesis protein CcdA/thiol-disulfide isomerase/thioredoxin